MSTLTSAIIDVPAPAQPVWGWFAHAIRLWLEHNARVLALGGEPL
ncbi:hypothetical protein [Methylobacterium radiodurans]|nr:hypothetical protein [Methylobacterium radiodurans]